jgi:hypothetical protein
LQTQENPLPASLREERVRVENKKVAIIAVLAEDKIPTIEKKDGFLSHTCSNMKDHKLIREWACTFHTTDRVETEKRRMWLSATKYLHK